MSWILKSTFLTQAYVLTIKLEKSSGNACDFSIFSNNTTLEQMLTWEYGVCVRACIACISMDSTFDRLKR